MMLAKSSGDALEESAPLAGPTVVLRSTIPKNGDLVRRRLACCVFLYVAGAAIVMQVYPKVILEYFDNDDGEASKFNGWLAFFSSAINLIAIPAMSSFSDTVGRRAVLGGSFALSAASAFALGLAPNSIVAVAISKIVSALGLAMFPVSQAIIVDVSYWGEDEGRGEVSHGLGLIGATTGLGIGVGPIVGGALSELHRRTACNICAALSLLAVVSLRFYGWDETAPQRRLHGAARGANGGGMRGNGRRSEWRIVNPFSILNVFLESSPLLLLSLCVFCVSMAVAVFDVYYNYLDFRYHWSALEISYFYSLLGVLLAATSSVGIRFLVPKRLSEGQAILLGFTINASSAILYGLAPRGWMLYLVMVISMVQFIVEPCVQAIMARLVGDDLQGCLQGATMSLRLVAQGVAGPMYGQAFSLGVSDATKEALGFLVPGLPLFIASVCSLCGLAIGWYALRKLGDSPALNHTPPVAEPLDVDEESVAASSPDVTEDGDSLEAFESAALTVASAALTPHVEQVDAMSELSQPLLSDDASSELASRS